MNQKKNKRRDLVSAAGTAGAQCMKGLQSRLAGRKAFLSAEDPSWPRSHVKPDLEVECLDKDKDGHVHLAHTFPLYLLSVYFQKAILFENCNSHSFADIKRLKLSFSCATVRELINFAYDGQLDSSLLDESTFENLLYAAEYTVSVRMTAYLRTLEKQLFPKDVSAIEKDN